MLLYVAVALSVISCRASGATQTSIEKTNSLPNGPTGALQPCQGDDFDVDGLIATGHCLAKDTSAVPARTIEIEVANFRYPEGEAPTSFVVDLRNRGVAPTPIVIQPSGFVVVAAPQQEALGAVALTLNAGGRASVRIDCGEPCWEGRDWKRRAVRTTGTMAAQLGHRLILVSSDSDQTRTPGTQVLSAEIIDVGLETTFNGVVDETTLETHRLTGQRRIPLDPQTRLAMLSTEKIVFVRIRVCIDETGAVSQTTPEESTGFPGYDAKLRIEIPKWRYVPFRIGDNGVAVCSIYTIHADRR